MKLSDRLESICDYIAYDYLADIGTDHGYVPIYATTEKISKRAIACDINEGPLLRAQDNIDKYGAKDFCEVRLSDGLSNLKPNEVDTIIITGMGGLLIRDILSKGIDVVKEVKQLILSPQGDGDRVKHFLDENNYVIVREKVVKDEGKYYNIIDARNFNIFVDKKYMFSGSILGNPDKTFIRFLDKKIKTCDEIIANVENSENGEKLIMINRKNKEFYMYCKKIAKSCLNK